MEYVRKSRFLNVKEAAVQYQVSRAKLHRLINVGRLRATKDARDERATLLSVDELDELFGPTTEEIEGGEKMGNTRMSTGYSGYEAGRVTAEWCARMDALRERIFAKTGTVGADSTEIIRAERDKRDRQLYDAASGGGTRRRGRRA